MLPSQNKNLRRALSRWPALFTSEEFSTFPCDGFSVFTRDEFSIFTPDEFPFFTYVIFGLSRRIIVFWETTGVLIYTVKIHVSGFTSRIISISQNTIIGRENTKLITRKNRELIAGENRKLIAGENRRLIAGENWKLIASEKHWLTRERPPRQFCS